MKPENLETLRALLAEEGAGSVLRALHGECIAEWKRRLRASEDERKDADRYNVGAFYVAKAADRFRPRPDAALAALGREATP